MDRPTTPGGSHYGRPPAYDDEDDFSPQMQGGSTMRLLTNVDESQSYMPRRSFESASLMSGVNSTTAALGERMTPSEIGRQKMAEADIVDFLREAGDALSFNPHASGAGLSSQMPRRKTLKSRPPSPVSRTYHPMASSMAGLSRTPSVLDTAPNMPPPTEGSPGSYLPYRRSHSPDRPAPGRPYSPTRTSVDYSRPPASVNSYEPVDLNGSPRPGTPSSRYGGGRPGSPKRPLPPAPLFAGGARPVSRDSEGTMDMSDMTSIPMDDKDDPFTEYGDDRPNLRSRDSYMTDDTYTDVYTAADDDKAEHYGPAPDGAQARRGARDAVMTKKEVRLINGELILECNGTLNGRPFDSYIN